MISTIERDFVVKDGVASFPMKQYPNWYGIEDVGFIYHNEWSDPEIEYNGMRINATIVEDTMWERWICDEDGNFDPEKEKDLRGFELFMKENANEIYELIEEEYYYESDC